MQPWQRVLQPTRKLSDVNGRIKCQKIVIEFEIKQKQNVAYFEVNNSSEIHKIFSTQNMTYKKSIA